MLWRKLLVVSMLMCVCSPALAEEDDEKLTPQDKQALCEKLAPSLVQVEYHLKYDKGEAPDAQPGSFNSSGFRSYRSYSDSETLIKEERPLEVAGFVVSKNLVVARDVMIHPRFIKEIRVRLGDDSVAAKVDRCFLDAPFVVLELEEPLPNAVAVNFKANLEEPYFAISHGRQNAVWATTIKDFSSQVAVMQDGDAFAKAANESLVIDKTGAPVGLVLNTRLPIGDAWKGSPLNAATISADEMKGLLNACEKADEQRVLRVSLRFRSPKKKAGGMSWRFQARMEETGTEQNVVGILLSDKQILVVADMKPNKTALLNKILVYPQEGDAVEATFKGSLTDYGAFIAELEKPMPGSVALDGTDSLKLQDELLLGALVEMQGEKRVAYHQHLRLNSYAIRWKQQVFPATSGRRDNSILFNTAGELVAIPMSRRIKVSEQERWRRDSAILLPAAYLSDILAALDENTDPNNIPLSEEEENRLAWMGVVMQGLNTELARINNVSDLTNDGSTGVLISYVYPDSPAAAAGVEPGWILLRLHVEGEPKPYEVQFEDMMSFFGGAFPWDELDDVPPEIMDDIPTPWPAAENTFTRALSDMGFGKSYTAEFFHDGEVVKKDFFITQSPPHYDSAPRIKSDALGLTVRDLTFEVRHYFQKTNEDPGVVISKVEPGSKVAVAGIKPFELITAVNDTPIHGVKEFEAAIAGKTELRFAVKRMTRGRIVKVKLDEPLKDKSEEKSTDRADTAQTDEDTKSESGDNTADAPTEENTDAEVSGKADNLAA